MTTIENIKESNFVTIILNMSGSVSVIAAFFMIGLGPYGIPLAIGAIISGVILFAISDHLILMRKQINLLSEISEKLSEVINK